MSEYMTEQRRELLEFFRKNHDRCFNAKDVAEALKNSNISISAIYRNLARLEHDGYLSRTVKKGSRESYYQSMCAEIVRVREWTIKQLQECGFTVLPSDANFIFAKSDRIDGEKLYLELKKRGILIRHFTARRICQYNRITIGTQEQMETFIETVKLILSNH